MHELGIMAYPDLSPMDRIQEYFHLAGRYGCTRVISSVLSVDGKESHSLHENDVKAQHILKCFCLVYL